MWWGLKIISFMFFFLNFSKMLGEYFVPEVGGNKTWTFLISMLWHWGIKHRQVLKQATLSLMFVLSSNLNWVIVEVLSSKSLEYLAVSLQFFWSHQLISQYYTSWLMKYHWLLFIMPLNCQLLEILLVQRPSCTKQSYYYLKYKIKNNILLVYWEQWILSLHFPISKPSYIPLLISFKISFFLKTSIIHNITCYMCPYTHKHLYSSP